MGILDRLRGLFSQRQLRVKVWDSDGTDYEVIDVPTSVSKKDIPEHLRRKYGRKCWWEMV